MSLVLFCLKIFTNFLFELFFVGALHFDASIIKGLAIKSFHCHFSLLSIFILHPGLAIADPVIIIFTEFVMKYFAIFPKDLLELGFRHITIQINYQQFPLLMHVFLLYKLRRLIKLHEGAARAYLFCGCRDRSDILGQCVISMYKIPLIGLSCISRVAKSDPFHFMIALFVPHAWCA
jgi:hypothetical protein